MTKELLLDPIVLLEELMFHILWNEFDGELNPDHKYFTLYVELQKLLDQENKNLTE